MGKEFCIKTAVFEPNTRYDNLNMVPCMDNFYRHPVTEKACGNKMNYGNLLAYLFRRFGYPNAAWDDDKQLAKYYLSTSLPDMILCVVPFAGDDTFLHFKFIVTESTAISIEAFELKEFDAFQERMFDWIETNNLLPDWMDDFVEECSKAFGQKKDWRITFGYLSMFRHEKEEGKYKFIDDWFTEVTSRYEEIETRPHRGMSRSLEWEKWHDDDPLKKYYQAAYETLLDLRRPVHIRDISINAFGRIPDEELDKYPASAEYAASAGYPSGKMGNEAPKEMAELHARISELGDGDIKNGLQKVLALCSPADKINNPQ